jgi:hypothetical protein
VLEAGQGAAEQCLGCLVTALGGEDGAEHGYVRGHGRVGGPRARSRSWTARRASGSACAWWPRAWACPVQVVIEAGQGWIVGPQQLLNGRQGRRLAALGCLEATGVRIRVSNQDGDVLPGLPASACGWCLAFGGYGEQGGRVVVVGAVVVVEVVVVVVVVGHGPVVVEGVVVVVVDGVVVLVVMGVVVADELVGGRVVGVDGPGAARVVEGAGPGCLAVEDRPAVVGPGRGDGPEGGAAAAPGGPAARAGPTATPPS